jgi:hypothetical protein
MTEQLKKAQENKGKNPREKDGGNAPQVSRGDGFQCFAPFVDEAD